MTQQNDDTERDEQGRGAEHPRGSLGNTASSTGEPMPSAESSTPSTKIWAGVSVIAMAIVAAAVITLTLAIHNHRAPLTSAAAPPRSHPLPTAAARLPATAPSHSSSLPTTAAHLPAASDNAPGLATFAREWRGGREGIVIDSTGHGHFHYMMPCATCTNMAEMPYGTIDFTLTSVSNSAANGSVTASSDPRFPVGEPVAATLAPRDTMKWSVGGIEEGLFCGSDFAWCGG